MGWLRSEKVELQEEQGAVGKREKEELASLQVIVAGHGDGDGDDLGHDVDSIGGMDGDMDVDGSVWKEIHSPVPSMDLRGGGGGGGGGASFSRVRTDSEEVQEVTSF